MRYLSIAAMLGLLAGLGLPSGCQPGPGGLPVQEVRAEEKAGGDWGAIKGQVVLAEGVEVNPAKVDVNQDQTHCLSKGDIYREDWVVNKGNRGVKNVFAWLTPDPTNPTAAPPIHPSLAKPKAKEVEIDQPCCKFEPHALGMRVGQVLVAKNSAPVSHNVNWVKGNVSIPAGKQHEIKDLDKAEKIPIPVSCNIHRWMSARVGVFDHPYFALTDENGNFEIKDAPAGDYYLILNHEGAGWCGLREGKKYGKKITIKANDTTNLGKFEIRPTD
jgi:hypothetical protein